MPSDILTFLRSWATEPMRVGAVARVDRPRYRPISKEVNSRAALAGGAPGRFDQPAPPRLVGVTGEDCAPPTRHYRSNVVLVADPV